MKSSLHKLLFLFISVSLFSCTKDDPIPAPKPPVVLDCVRPDYLKTGDKVALISPSYYTPMENVEESMHNIDRQVRILQMNGVLDRCKGIILGEFDGCGTEFKDEYGNTISVETMLHKIFAPYNIPVLCGFPAGHGDVNPPLVMGAHVIIDVSSTGSTISFDIEGQQKEFRITPDIKSTKSSVNLRMVLAGKKTFGYEKD